MELHITRRRNLLTLYAQFVAQSQKDDPSISVSGLDRAFAVKLQIANTSLSSMKSGSRAIGKKMAQQFAVISNRPLDWLDQDHTIHEDDTFAAASISSVTHAKTEEPFDVRCLPKELGLEEFLQLAKRSYERCSHEDATQMIKILKNYDEGERDGK